MAACAYAMFGNGVAAPDAAGLRPDPCWQRPCREVMMDLGIRPIGHVSGGRADPVDDHWQASQAVIKLDPQQFGADALAGLDGFSHVEIIFLFDKVPLDRIETGARHPRNRQDWPLTGIFAQRGKNRPNRLGVTICEIRAVEGTLLHVQGLDAIDGTPVLDIKPVMREFLPRGTIRQPAWVSELMAEYW